MFPEVGLGRGKKGSRAPAPKGCPPGGPKPRGAGRPPAATAESAAAAGPSVGGGAGSAAAAPAAASGAPGAGAAAAAPAAAVSGADEEEVREIEAELRAQLRAWAADSGMTEDEQKRCVRGLLAQWHPDKNQHIHAIATRVFQFIQEEVSSIVAELRASVDVAAKKEAEAAERKAQRAAEKSAKAAALMGARADKEKERSRKAKGGAGTEVDEKDEEGAAAGATVAEEWSLVIGHGPATTSHLRPWPRSHLTLVPSPVASRRTEILLFGGEAYDGREQTFYSDLYRLSLLGARAEEGGRPAALPWEKIYSAVPLVPGPEARSSHQAVAWDRFLYVFGGEWSSRDQRRYRQFGDLWRIDATGGPGTRWERLEAEGAPAPRSGHRMAALPSGHASLFGGFTEDKRKKATYLDDLHVLHLPTCSWAAVAPDRTAARPCRRAACLLWTTPAGAYVFGGVRPKSKGGDGLTIMEDLWHATVAPSAPSGSAPGPAACGGLTARWRQLPVQGQGPGRRSGLCQCQVSAARPLQRLVFGGVADVHVADPGGAGARGRKSKGAEVSIFHQDLWLLDCEAPGGPAWSRLWPVPGAGPAVGLEALRAAGALPPELRRGGGLDALALHGPREDGPAGARAQAGAAPRGRIGAGCVVCDGVFWVFGGSCEAGRKQEVTLDDMWRLELRVGDTQEGGCEVQAADAWECVLPLSDRATVWFDDSDTDEESEADQADAPAGHDLVPLGRGGDVLAKRAQKDAAKKARAELKRERQQEKCEEKTSKRDLKKEKQRAQARGEL